MNDITPRKIKTGGDPRTLPDYAALREELSKLTHPARPDINWRYAEGLCLSLFEQNGAELQTLSWYTLARTQLAGLSGLNDGLAILEALISHHWSMLWPQPVHARMEILSSLSQRLQQQMRRLPLDYSDLGQLYRAEQLLTSLGAVLQRLELKHLSQLDTLRTLMHNNAVKLESSGDTASAEATIRSGSVSASAVKGVEASVDAVAGPPPEGSSAPDSTVKCDKAQSEHPAEVNVLPVVSTPVRQWKSFAAGMGTMLVISALAAWSWQYFQRPDPLQSQLAASLAPLPATLTSAQRDVLRQNLPSPQFFIAETQRQLARLDKLPPDWNIALSRQLVEQAQALWPKQAKPLEQQWLRQVNVSALPAEGLNGWYEGMGKLQELTAQLNALDGQKGKYITVSELKSQVFAATQAFSKTVPVEEQLRQMSMQKNPEIIPSAQKTQTEQHLKQLIAYYSAVTTSQ